MSNVTVLKGGQLFHLDRRWRKQNCRQVKPSVFALHVGYDRKFPRNARWVFYADVHGADCANFADAVVSIEAPTCLSPWKERR